MRDRRILTVKSSLSFQNLEFRDQTELIMLGGTDLALVFNELTTNFPLIDCAGIHADAIARLAIA